MIIAKYDKLEAIKELEIEGQAEYLINEITNMTIDLVEFLTTIDNTISIDDVIQGLNEYKKALETESEVVMWDI